MNALIIASLETDLGFKIAPYSTNIIIKLLLSVLYLPNNNYFQDEYQRLSQQIILEHFLSLNFGLNFLFVFKMICSQFHFFFLSQSSSCYFIVWEKIYFLLLCICTIKTFRLAEVDPARLLLSGSQNLSHFALIGLRATSHCTLFFPQRFTLMFSASSFILDFNVTSDFKVKLAPIHRKGLRI